MDFNISSYAKARSRRSHVKSRRGCGNCKRRRIKCDETEPECTNCIRHSIKCNYGQVAQRAKSTDSDERDNAQPKNDYKFITSSASSFTVPKRSHHRTEVSPMQQSPPVESGGTVAKNPFQFTATDMILFHHCLSTSDLKDYIPEQLVRLGLSVHYVLHLLLAISGFHMKRTSANTALHQSPQQDPDFYSEAERHLNIAISEVAATGLQLHKENHHTLYIASLFIFICSLARGPQPSEYLGFRNDNDTPALCLFNGMRSILEAGTSMESSESILEVHPQAKQGITQEEEQEQEKEKEKEQEQEQMSQSTHDLPASGITDYNTGNPSARFAEPLYLLKGLILDSFPPGDHRRSTYSEVFESLQSRYWLILGGPAPIPAPELWPNIFSWLYMLPEDFVQEMQRKHPVALLLFSYFAVLLNQLDFVWFIRGWPLHIVQGAGQNLTAFYQPFIRWPLTQLGVDLNTQEWSPVGSTFETLGC